MKIISPTYKKSIQKWQTEVDSIQACKIRLHQVKLADFIKYFPGRFVLGVIFTLLLVQTTLCKQSSSSSSGDSVKDDVIFVEENEEQIVFDGKNDQNLHWPIENDLLLKATRQKQSQEVNLNEGIANRRQNAHLN